jgi:hypothetical protein
MTNVIGFEARRSPTFNSPLPRMIPIWRIGLAM